MSVPDRLLATTSLVLGAGVAAAEGISMSGDARIGISYQDNDLRYYTGVGRDNANINFRTRLHFRFDGETDDGVAFGFRQQIRWDKGNNGGDAGTARVAQNRAAFIGGSAFVSYEGLTFTMGNTDPAISNTVALYGGALGYDANVMGLFTYNGAALGTEIWEQESTGTGLGGTKFRLDYAIDAFTISVGADERFDYLDIAAKYSADGITVAAGINNESEYAISAEYAADGLGLGALYVSNGTARGWATYDVTSEANLGLTVDRNQNGDLSYGVGMKYSLGGGATAHLAAASVVANPFANSAATDLTGPAQPRTTVASAGLTFRF